jgi:hypothetical protein
MYFIIKQKNQLKYKKEDPHFKRKIFLEKDLFLEVKLK